jgi:hypothetical protein
LDPLKTKCVRTDTGHIWPLMLSPFPTGTFDNEQILTSFKTL